LRDAPETRDYHAYVHARGLIDKLTSPSDLHSSHIWTSSKRHEMVLTRLTY